MRALPTVREGSPVPNLLGVVMRVAKKVVGYGRDLTPEHDKRQEAERLQEIAANMKRAGVNTRAVERAAEIRRSAKS